MSASTSKRKWTLRRVERISGRLVSEHLGHRPGVAITLACVDCRSNELGQFGFIEEGQRQATRIGAVEIGDG